MSDTTNNTPLEFSFEKAKNEIVNAVNYIGQLNNIPSSVLLLILENVMLSIKSTMYSEIMSSYKVPEDKPEDNENKVPEPIELN